MRGIFDIPHSSKSAASGLLARRGRLGLPWSFLAPRRPVPALRPPWSFLAPRRPAAASRGLKTSGPRLGPPWSFLAPRRPVPALRCRFRSGFGGCSLSVKWCAPCTTAASCGLTGARLSPCTSVHHDRDSENAASRSSGVLLAPRRPAAASRGLKTSLHLSVGSGCLRQGAGRNAHEPARLTWRTES